MINEGVAMKSTTTGIALMGLITPMWLPTLAQISEHMALWTPILGAVWLATQILRSWFGKVK